MPTPPAESADPATKEALRYRTALGRGLRAARTHGRCRPPLPCEICRTLKGVEIDVRSDARHGADQRGDRRGRLHAARGRSDPPRPARELGALSPRGARRRSADPDGRRPTTSSRRSTRSPTATAAPGGCSTCCFWSSRACSSIPVLYLSQHIITRKADYYRLLLEVTTRRPGRQWILYMLRRGRGDRPLDHRARSERSAT